VVQNGDHRLSLWLVPSLPRFDYGISPKHADRPHRNCALRAALIAGRTLHGAFVCKNKADGAGDRETRDGQ
jgi:hypothetical protein